MKSGNVNEFVDKTTQDYKNGVRQSARELTNEEYKIYYKYFGGKK